MGKHTDEKRKKPSKDVGYSSGNLMLEFTQGGKDKRRKMHEKIDTEAANHYQEDDEILNELAMLENSTQKKKKKKKRDKEEKEEMDVADERSSFKKNKVSDAATEINAKKPKHKTTAELEKSWLQQDENELINRIIHFSSAIKKKIHTYDALEKVLDWSLVVWGGWSEDDCRLKAKQLIMKIKTRKPVAQILSEALEYVNNPVAKTAHIRLPVMRYYDDHVDELQRRNPEMNQLGLLGILKKQYKGLSIEEASIYVDAYNGDIENALVGFQFDEALDTRDDQIVRPHHDVAEAVPRHSVVLPDKRYHDVAEAVPMHSAAVVLPEKVGKKVVPFSLFCEKRGAKKKTEVDAARLEWAALSKKRRSKYIEKSWNAVIAMVEAAAIGNVEVEQKFLKTKGPSEEERKILLRRKGFPSVPAGTAASFYYASLPYADVKPTNVMVESIRLFGLLDEDTREECRQHHFMAIEEFFTKYDNFMTENEASDSVRLLVEVTYQIEQIRKRLTSLSRKPTNVGKKKPISKPHEGGSSSPVKAGNLEQESGNSKKVVLFPELLMSSSIEPKFPPATGLNDINGLKEINANKFKKLRTTYNSFDPVKQSAFNDRSEREKGKFIDQLEKYFNKLSHSEQSIYLENNRDALRKYFEGRKGPHFLNKSDDEDESDGKSSKKSVSLESTSEDERKRTKSRLTLPIKAFPASKKMIDTKSSAFSASVSNQYDTTSNESD